VTERKRKAMSKKGQIILWIITLVSFAGILAVYHKLPERVPIHWDSNWEVDGTANKNMMFLIGAVPALANGLFYLLPVIDPRRKNYDAKTYGLMRAVIVLLFVFISWATVVSALKLGINDKLLLSFILGITFIIMGNYLPKVKSNFFIGIKNPWALSDATIWRKTHKVGGYFFLIIGLLMLPMGIINTSLYSNVIFWLLLIGIAAVNIYSYILYRKNIRA
jgi:uncharacterized membrane protein